MFFFFFSWFPYDPMFTLAMSEPFYLRCMTVSKFQFLGMSVAWICTVSLEDGLVRLPSRSKERSCTTVLWSIVYTKKLAPRPAALSQLPSFYAWEKHSTLVSPVLPATQWILRPFCHSWGFAPLHHLITFNAGTSLHTNQLKSSDFSLQYFMVASTSRLSPHHCIHSYIFPKWASTPPNFQKAVAFLLIDLKFLFFRTPIDFLGVQNNLVTI